MAGILSGLGAGLQSLGESSSNNRKARTDREHDKQIESARALREKNLAELRHKHRTAEIEQGTEATKARDEAKFTHDVGLLDMRGEQAMKLEGVRQGGATARTRLAGELQRERDALNHTRSIELQDITNKYAQNRDDVKYKRNLELLDKKYEQELERIEKTGEQTRETETHKSVLTEVEPPKSEYMLDAQGNVTLIQGTTQKPVMRADGTPATARPKSTKTEQPFQAVTIDNGPGSPKTVLSYDRRDGTFSNAGPPISLEQAQRMARAEAEGKASWLSFDKTDFGGSREAWINNRTLEIMDQAGGQSSAPLPPPAAPATPARVPPSGAVEMLKAKPHLRDAFDAKYGAGAAARVLGR